MSNISIDAIDLALEQSKKRMYARRPEAMKRNRERSASVYKHDRVRVLARMRQYYASPRVQKERRFYARCFYIRNRVSILERQKKRNALPHVRSARKKYYATRFLRIKTATMLDVLREMGYLGGEQ